MGSRRIVITRVGERPPRRRRGGTIALVVVLVLFLGIGATAIVSGVRGIVVRHSERATTTGRVIDGGLCLSRSGVAATARYVVDGRTYTTSNGDCAPDLNDVVTVRYDPDDPARADFRAHPTSNDVIGIVVGSVLLLFALGLGGAPWWGPRVVWALARRTARRLGLPDGP